MNIENLKYDEKGLICAIAQDALTGEVLMQAYMNREAVEKTIESGYATYFSRSRNKLWLKGETSGHLQKVVSISIDCDNDCLLLKIIQSGAACHTGNYSCFYTEIKENEYMPDYKIIFEIAKTIKERRENPQEGSYTNYLFNKGTEKICKKIGEEATEAVIAAIKDDKLELIGEVCDIVYHLLVLMEVKDIPLQEIFFELLSREGRTPKAKYAVLDNDSERNREKK